MDEFIPLGAFLRPPVPGPPDYAALPDVPDVPVQTDPPDVRDAVRAARLFRARLADALDAALDAMLRELASAVLARELRIEPANIARLAAQTMAHAPVVRVRVCPEDVHLVTDTEVIADAALLPGDAIFELDGGAFDARLGVRLASVLEMLI